MCNSGTHKGPMPTHISSFAHLFYFCSSPTSTHSEHWFSVLPLQFQIIYLYSSLVTILPLHSHCLFCCLIFLFFLELFVIVLLMFDFFKGGPHLSYFPIRFPVMKSTYNCSDFIKSYFLKFNIMPTTTSY